MRHMKDFTVVGLLPMKTVDDPACRFTDRYGKGGTVADWDVYVLLDDDQFHWARYAWTEAQARYEARTLSYRQFTAVKIVNSEKNTAEFFAYGKVVA